MKAFVFLVVVIFALTAHADAQDPCERDDQPGGCEATEAVAQESAGDPAETGSDQTTQSAVSPWQGTWVGSENNSFGMKLPVRAKITVTNGTISGTWNAKKGLQPITGQVDSEDAKKAAISILQGGSLIKATLVDENTFKYSGLSGYGTLKRQ